MLFSRFQRFQSQFLNWTQVKVLELSLVLVVFLAHGPEKGLQQLMLPSPQQHPHHLDSVPETVAYMQGLCSPHSHVFQSGFFQWKSTKTIFLKAISHGLKPSSKIFSTNFPNYRRSLAFAQGLSFYLCRHLYPVTIS